MKFTLEADHKAVLEKFANIKRDYEYKRLGNRVSKNTRWQISKGR